MNLDDLAWACAEVQRDAEEDPVKYIRWMVPQDRFLRLDGKSKLYRAGNQALGKSTVGLAEVLMHVRGRHPYRVVKPPPVQWVVCSLNRSQSLAIMGKFHALVGAGELADGSTYNAKTGYGINNPVTIFRNGSTVRWITDDQGPRAVAGATLDGVLVDEPCGPEMLRELEKRLLRRSGTLLVTMTPINGPTKHFRERVAAGTLVEVHAPMNTTQLRWADNGETAWLEDGTPCDARWIAAERAKTPPLWGPIVNDGEWEELPQGVFFANFDPARHVSAAMRFPPAPAHRLRWYMGIDYAAADRDFGQVAILARVLEVPRADVAGSDWLVYVVDEVVGAGTMDSDEFADGIVTALARNGIGWQSLDRVNGDNPVSSRWEEKSNVTTMKALSRRLRIPYNALQPRILNAKEAVRSSGSRAEGCRVLYGLIGKQRFAVHPRCITLTKGLTTWDYSREHPYCDVVDALRYALKPAIFPHGGRAGVTMRVAV